METSCSESVGLSDSMIVQPPQSVPFAVPVAFYESLDIDFLSWVGADAGDRRSWEHYPGPVQGRGHVSVETREIR